MKHLGFLWVCAGFFACTQGVGHSNLMHGREGGALEAASAELWAAKPPAVQPAAAKPAQPPAAQPDSPDAASKPESAAPAPLDRRLVTYEIRLSVGVFEPEKTAVEVISAVEKLGGYLNSRTNNQLVLRLPAGVVDAFGKDIEKLGIVSRRVVSSEDITANWVDATLRLNNQLATRTRLQAILANARNVTETLAVEKELNRVTTEIERLKGQLRLYANRVEFAVVRVDFFVRHGPSSITPSPVKLDTPIYWIKRFDIVNLFRD